LIPVLRLALCLPQMGMEDEDDIDAIVHQFG
jgi:hypothetical protein